MQITTINNIEQFDALKDNWDRVYSSDNHATVFLSWAWIRGWLQNTSFQWLTLAAQSDTGSSYVAFMVIALEPAGKTGDALTFSLYMGGHPFADHTGFVCLPEHVEEAIPIFATFIKNELKWNKFFLRSVFDPRLDIFLRCFAQKRFTLTEGEPTSSPYIPLPATWNEYLQNCPDKKTRIEIGQKTRKLNRLNNFHITHAQNDNIESQIDTLLTLWKTRWELNSDDYFMGFKSGHVLDISRSVYRSCFKYEHLWLCIFWDGEIPIAGNAAFYDKQKGCFIAYTIAVNYQFAKLSPGMVINSYQIQHAIENGFRIFDFGLGDEKHKFNFGAKERFTRNITIRQTNLTTKIRDRLRIRNRLRNLFGKIKISTNSNHPSGS